MNPTVSIVMATRNAAKWLPRALASLSSQTLPDYELIVQDACSSDDTLRFLRRFDGPCDIRSEPDNGVYDAWNKALSRVHGTWVLFLGADDMLAGPETLARAVPLLSQCGEEVIFAYGVLLKGRAGTVAEIYRLSVNAVFINLPCRMSLPFPATFVRGAVLREQGFDATYRICGDYDFVARNATYGGIRRLPMRISYMEAGGVSDDPRYARLHAREHERVIERHVLPRAKELITACVLSRYETESDEH